MDKKEFSYREDLTKKEPLLKTKEDANEYLSIQKEDLGNYFSVWLNQAIDVHPPLFYFCLHFFLFHKSLPYKNARIDGKPPVLRVQTAEIHVIMPDIIRTDFSRNYK